jgi:hypothetical protein
MFSDASLPDEGPPVQVAGPLSRPVEDTELLTEDRQPLQELTSKLEVVGYDYASEPPEIVHEGSKIGRQRLLEGYDTVEAAETPLGESSEHLQPQNDDVVRCLAGAAENQREFPDSPERNDRLQSYDIVERCTPTAAPVFGVLDIFDIVEMAEEPCNSARSPVIEEETVPGVIDAPPTVLESVVSEPPILTNPVDNEALFVSVSPPILLFAQFSEAIPGSPRAEPVTIVRQQPSAPQLSLHTLPESVHVASTVTSPVKTVDHSGQTDPQPKLPLEVTPHIAEFGVGEFDSGSARAAHLLPPHLPPYKFHKLRSEISAIWPRSTSAKLFDGCDASGNTVVDPELATIPPVSRYEQLHGGKSLLPFMPPSHFPVTSHQGSVTVCDNPTETRLHDPQNVVSNQREHVDRRFAALTASVAELQAENSLLKRKLDASKAELDQVACLFQLDRKTKVEDVCCILACCL